MSFSVVSTFIAVVGITWPVHVLAIPFISTVVLQNESNNITLVCEVDDSFKPKVTMSAGDEILAVVDRNSNSVSAHPLLQEARTHPQVDTFGDNKLHVALAIPRSYYGQGLTCSSTISSSMFRLQTNYELLDYATGSTKEPLPDTLGISVNPGYLEYSSDTHRRVRAQFICTANFESSASLPFSWSLIGKNSGEELLNNDLETLMERNLSIEVNISRKESILTIDGLDFPSIPDDIIVTCSSRLTDDDDDDLVSSSSTVRIGHGSDLRNKDRVILGLSVAVVLLFLFFLLSLVVICLFCRICERKGKQPQVVGQDLQNIDDDRPRPSVSPRGNSPDVTDVVITNVKQQEPPTIDEPSGIEHFPSTHSYVNVKKMDNSRRNGPV